MKVVSIVIPTCNGLHLLRECVHSIRTHTHTPYELIIVDNGSVDGTLEYCRNEKLICISNTHKTGFPRACNDGLRLASGDALLLLNNDVIVSRYWLSNLLNALYSSEEVGAVGPMTNYGSGLQQSTKTYTTLDEMADYYNQAYKGQYEEVQRIIGLCLLFKREVMQKIGILDEQFSPGHYEDDDYCYRMRQVGYRLMLARDTFIYHQGSASFGQEDEQQVQQWIARNRQLFMNKWGVDPTTFIQEPKY